MYALMITPVNGKPQGPFDVLPGQAPVTITIPQTMRGITVDVVVPGAATPDAPGTLELALVAPSGAAVKRSARVTPAAMKCVMRERFFNLVEGGQYELQVSFVPVAAAAAAPAPAVVLTPAPPVVPSPAPSEPAAAEPETHA